MRLISSCSVQSSSLLLCSSFRPFWRITQLSPWYVPLPPSPSSTYTREMEAYELFVHQTRLVIVFLHALMETVLAFMNHFPLFAVMLRLKDSARLPGGLEFELCTTKGEAGEGYLRMRNNPLHLAGIFFAQYVIIFLSLCSTIARYGSPVLIKTNSLKLSRRLASHYSPVYLLGRLLTGTYLLPLPSKVL